VCRLAVGLGRLLDVDPFGVRAYPEAAADHRQREQQLEREVAIELHGAVALAGVAADAGSCRSNSSHSASTLAVSGVWAP
jgi:hypothetical protein